MGFISDFLFGSETEQMGTAQSPGNAWLQNALRPMLGQGIGAGMGGQPLYPTQGYNAPQAPFSSPADFAGGYENIINRMMEPYGDALGGAMGGFSGAGQNIMGSAMGQIAPQIMNQYTQNQGMYDQMGAQASMFGANAMNQSYGAPWNLAGMYAGSTGSPMVQPGQQGLMQSIAPFAALGWGQGGFQNPFSSAPAGGANALSSAGAGSGLGSAGANAMLGSGSYGAGAGLGYTAGGPLGNQALHTALNSSTYGAGGGAGGGISSGFMAGGGPIYAGLAAAPILGPTMTKGMKSFAQSLGMGGQTAPTGGQYLQGYLGGIAPGTDMGFGQQMPGADWWGKSSNVASMLAGFGKNANTTISQNSPLIGMVQRGEIGYGELDALIRQYGTYNDPTAH